ncbi:MAG: fibronectin type III domain-containing protein [Patescibacteria group bacterium]
MKKFIIPILFLLPFSAFAANPPLSVIFSPNPLFEALNFVPGDSKEANITVGNSDTVIRNAYVEAVNISNNGNLASQMNLRILDGSTEIYNNNFEAFLNAGPVPLSSIGTDGSKTYNLKITFLENANDNYQGKTLKFDVCVGFSGGGQHCTNDIVITPERGTGGGTSGGSSGGSHLMIYNERNEVPLPQTTEVIVHWETNKPATSQVIYGLASGGPYTLDLTLPKFGYPSITPEGLIKVINHSVLLTGLLPGETYVYRVVSRASPPTISYEHEFTVPISDIGTTNPLTKSAPLGFSWGEILGASSDNNGAVSESGSVASTSNENNLAAAFSGGWNSLFSWWLWILIILLIAYIFWRFVIKSRNEGD